MKNSSKLFILTVVVIAGVLLAHYIVFVKPHQKVIIAGFDKNDVTAAHARWGFFEEWVKSQPQYKGWESDPEIFKKANEEYKNKVHPNVQVLK